MPVSIRIILKSKLVRALSLLNIFLQKDVIFGILLPVGFIYFLTSISIYEVVFNEENKHFF